MFSFSELTELLLQDRNNAACKIAPCYFPLQIPQEVLIAFEIYHYLLCLSVRT